MNLLKIFLVFIFVATFFSCETCAKGYFKSNGVCVKDLKCKNGGIQKHDVCVCPEIWTGTSCQTAVKCPVYW